MVKCFMKNNTYNLLDLVFVPHLSNFPLKPKQFLNNFGEIAALKVTFDGQSCIFSTGGYEYDEYGVETHYRVAFPANEKIAVILSDIYGKEIMFIEESNKITETLKVCDFVPCLFSQTVKPKNLILETCDCMGFVTQLPSAETNYRYVNLVDGELYKYAVFFNIADGTTVV